MATRFPLGQQEGLGVADSFRRKNIDAPHPFVPV
jgi:hypothetical protein